MCGVLVLRLFLWFLILLAALLFPYTSTSVLTAPMWLLHRMEEVERGGKRIARQKELWESLRYFSDLVCMCPMWDVGSYKTSERHAESQASASWQWSEAQETDWKLPNHMRHARKSRKQKITHLKHLVKYHLCVSISCGFVRFCFLNGCLRGPSLMLCTRTSLSSPTVTTKWFSSLRSQVLRFCSSTSTVHAQYTVYTGSIRAVYGQYTSTCPVLVTTPAARPCLHACIVQRCLKILKMETSMQHNLLNFLESQFFRFKAPFVFERRWASDPKSKRSSSGSFSKE